ncbi:MAG: hypothetical protein KatS3mg129_0157 [Leptospiraceae bacterium]|nr:MAG: hypothetical protein KatS3mg129_0157 [Leptospiraceae bacterium]
MEFNLSNRRIDFCVVYTNIEKYDLELVNFFLEKLYNLLSSISTKTFRKQLKIFIQEKFPVYFVSKNYKYLNHLKEHIKSNYFDFHYIEAKSLQDAIFNISPSIDNKTLSEIKNNSDNIKIIETYDTFLYFESISPFLDIEHSVNLILDHFTYLAEYTYSDIAIPGFLPVICNIELAKRIFIEEKEYFWNWSEYLLRNTQTVDLEIYYIEPDYRKYRVRFDLFNERYQKICRNIYDFNKHITYKEIEEIFKNHLELIRIAPTYIEIELTTKNELNPKIYPINKEENELSLTLYKKIIKDLKEFHLNQSFTLSLAGTGEPFLYNHLKKVLEIAIDSNLFHTIYLETFFYKLNEEILDYIQNFKDIITIIIKLPTLNESLYKELMGTNYLPQIKENLEIIKNNDLKIYVEILRIKQVEEELDSFFDYFKNTKIKPIIGKYNTFGNLLDDFSVVDLEPLEKDYCRSLMFQLYIDANGKVPICRQDILSKYKSYDINHSSLKEIFYNLKEYYDYFEKKQFDKIIPLCNCCKDWYVFLG